MRAMLLIVVLSVSCGCTVTQVDSPYGEIVTYAPNKDIQYPEITVRFVGERREMVEAYGRDFVYFDFMITSEGESIVASWTAGTGAVAPLLFSIDDKRYYLVLQINELNTDDYMLEDDEMIVWPQDAYMEQLKKTR